MSFTGLAAISPFVSQMDNTLRSFGFDLKQWIANVDIATVGIVMLVAALGFLLYDLVAFKLAGYSGNANNYHSYGRSLLTGAAEAWQQRDDLGLEPYFANVQGRNTLDVDNVSRVLDAISNAVLQYDSPTLSTAASSTHNTIAQHPKFPNSAATAPQQGQSGDWGWN